MAERDENDLTRKRSRQGRDAAARGLPTWTGERLPVGPIPKPEPGWSKEIKDLYRTTTTDEEWLETAQASDVAVLCVLCEELDAVQKSPRRSGEHMKALHAELNRVGVTTAGRRRHIE